MLIQLCDEPISTYSSLYAFKWKMQKNSFTNFGRRRLGYKEKQYQCVHTCISTQ